MKNALATSLLTPVIIMLALATGAEATLGETADSIKRDGRALSARRGEATAGDRYSVQEILSDGTAVREYLNPAGVVFAVAWDGLLHPDLKVLLGSYHLEYKSALLRQPRTKGRRQSRVGSERVVVETWGHMRNLQGRAYLPGMVPEGVSLYEIR